MGVFHKIDPWNFLDSFFTNETMNLPSHVPCHQLRGPRDKSFFSRQSWAERLYPVMKMENEEYLCGKSEPMSWSEYC